MASFLLGQQLLRAAPRREVAARRQSLRGSAARPAHASAGGRDAVPASDAVSLTRRGLAPALLALAVACPAKPAFAGLASYDVLGKGVLEATMALGTADNDFVFSPGELTFEQGRVYKLKLTNPSKVEHYFTARDFASKVFTILVETAGVEVKGAVTEVALEPGATLTWIFVPMRPGRYPLLCPVTGHVEAGMVGSLVVTPAAK